MGITVLWQPTECWIICKCSIGTRTVAGILTELCNRQGCGRCKSLFSSKVLQPSTCLFIGLQRPLPLGGGGVKEAGCEADHSHPFSVKVKND
jgi:hypothetical protein